MMTMITMLLLQTLLLRKLLPKMYNFTFSSYGLVYLSEESPSFTSPKSPPHIVYGGVTVKAKEPNIHRVEYIHC